jgi:hypothetical protein
MKYIFVDFYYQIVSRIFFLKFLAPFTEKLTSYVVRILFYLLEHKKIFLGKNSSSRIFSYTLCKWNFPNIWLFSADHFHISQFFFYNITLCMMNYSIVFASVFIVCIQGYYTMSTCSGCPILKEPCSLNICLWKVWKFGRYQVFKYVESFLGLIAH